MKPRLPYLLPLLLIALPLTMFAVQRNARKVTITEGVWVGTTLLSAGDYEVKWDGRGSVQVSFLQGNKSIATVPAIATAGPHDRAAVTIRPISESSKALDKIIWKDVSLTFYAQENYEPCDWSLSCCSCF